MERLATADALAARLSMAPDCERSTPKELAAFARLAYDWSTGGRGGAGTKALSEALNAVLGAVTAPEPKCYIPNAS
jgi:hypothetical protein